LLLLSLHLLLRFLPLDMLHLKTLARASSRHLFSPSLSSLRPPLRADIRVLVAIDANEHLFGFVVLY
jgi:hypothetical protein